MGIGQEIFSCHVGWGEDGTRQNNVVRGQRPHPSAPPWPIAIPSARWLKLNTNGSLLGNLRLAREGGIIRDEDDNWVMGFSRKIRHTTSFLVEMWNLLDELIICLNQNLSFVEVELDAKSIVDALANSSPSNNIVSPFG